MTSDQNRSAASRSRPSCRYTRTRSRDSSIVKNRRSHAQKNAIICRIRVREGDLAIRLRALARIQGRAGGEERIVGERADALDAEAVALLDLGELGQMLRMRAAIHARAAERCGSKGTSRTQRETEDFETPSSVAMSERACGPRREDARLLLQLDLPAVPHAGKSTEHMFV